jgi:hypothetical protein
MVVLGGLRFLLSEVTLHTLYSNPAPRLVVHLKEWSRVRRISIHIDLIFRSAWKGDWGLGVGGRVEVQGWRGLGVGVGVQGLGGLGVGSGFRG